MCLYLKLVDLMENSFRIVKESDMRRSFVISRFLALCFFS